VPRTDTSHAVDGVRIAGPRVHVICTCGWESAKYGTETAAREEFDLHAAGKKKPAKRKLGLRLKKGRK
jgi:hypothetical protein